MLKVKRRHLRGNVNKFNDVLHRKLSRVWTYAARAFVEAATDELARHKASGMTMGTMKPLADALGISDVIYKGGLGKERKGYYIHYNPREYVEDGIKSLGEGVRLAKSEGNYVFDVGKPKRVVLKFEFTRLTFQHFYHELDTGILASMSEGKDAFDEALDEKREIHFPMFHEWLEMTGEIYVD